jgi:hypothetical protein
MHAVETTLSPHRMRTIPMSHDINPAVLRLTRDGPLIPLGTRAPLEPGPYGAWVVPQHRRVVGSSAAPSQPRRRGLTAARSPTWVRMWGHPEAADQRGI